jgi:membrane protein YfhO
VVGPIVIVAGVLVVFHSSVLGSRVPSQHPDILGFWLPTYCFLGKSIAAGHIPAWNPHVMAGVPFAADPQSGWMYLPATLLFGALPCGAAIRVIVALQPALGGVALYGFLRSERLSRPAATSGGLVLALGLAASRLVLFLPFPSAFAWTAVLLWICSAFLRSGTWPARLGWAGLAAVAWGQLAAAYFAHGVILGTAAVAVYFTARARQAARDGGRSIRLSLSMAGLLVVTTVGMNLAFLLPRLAYASESSYGRILAGTAQLGPAPGLTWPLKLAVSPGGYLGILAAVLSLAAFWSRRHRVLALAFGVYGVACYLLGSNGLAHALARGAEGVPVLDFFAHFPGRFSLGLFIALPVLAAIGVDAWIEPRELRERAKMLAPGVVVFMVLPILLGAAGARLLIPGLAAGAGGVALGAIARRPRMAVLVPVVLVLELTANGLIGQTSGSLGAARAYADDLFDAASMGWLVPMAAPDVDVDAYLRPGPLARALGGSSDRFISLDPAEATERGYLTLQAPRFWGLLANQRAMLFGLEDAQGYDPVQLARYWDYVRATSGGPITYNASVYRAAPGAPTLDLLQIGAVVGREGESPVGGWSPAAREGEWVLYGSPEPPPRASVLSAWRVVDGPEASLRSVTAGAFDPSDTVVLEEDPGLGSVGTAPGGASSAAYRSVGLQAATVTVETASPAVVLVRNPYARNWHATVDGHPTRILAADHLLQAVPVHPGKHTIRLTYDDPWIGYGLLGSLLALLTLVVSALLMWRAGEGNRPTPKGQVVSAARSG